MRPLTQHLPWSLSRLHSAPTPCMWTTANSNTLVWGFLPESEQCGPWLGFQHRPSALQAARCPGFPPLSLSPITPHPIAHSPWRPIPSGFQTHAPSMMSQRHFGVNGNTLSHCPLPLPCLVQPSLTTHLRWPSPLHHPALVLQAFIII